MCEEMGNLRRNINTVKENQKEILYSIQIFKKLLENIVVDRISELEDSSI